GRSRNEKCSGRLADDIELFYLPARIQVVPPHEQYLESDMTSLISTQTSCAPFSLPPRPVVISPSCHFLRASAPTRRFRLQRALPIPSGALYENLPTL